MTTTCATLPEDVWAVVYPGDKFPEGAVRALNRGLQCDGEPHACDSYVALWIRSGGEAVFGRAWNDAGKAKALFPWNGQAICADQTEGFRVLTYIGPPSKHGFEYKWIKAREANEHELLYVGDYSPAVILCEEGRKESLGKANFRLKTAWTCCSSMEDKTAKEMCHQGQQFDSCYLLVKQKTEMTAGLECDDADQDEYF